MPSQLSNFHFFIIFSGAYSIW